MPTPSPTFISCDWGTTNFRLRAVETGSGQVLAELETHEGIRSTNQRYLASGTNDRFAFFATYLNEQLQRLPQQYHHCPVVASGMASSSIGMYELPYGALPLDASGSGLVCKSLPLGEGREILLISGMRSAESIMRGEETQALGLLERLSGEGDGTLILPGTHSKHLNYENGGFSFFATFLTGELFELLSSHSILAASVAAGPFDAEAEASFREGVGRGRTGNLSSSLFTVRVRQVVDGMSPAANYYYLSGLLLGEELRGLEQGGMVYLAAAEPLNTLYRCALEWIVGADRLRCFSGEVLESALLAGQTKILLQYGG